MDIEKAFKPGLLPFLASLCEMDGVVEIQQGIGKRTGKGVEGPGGVNTIDGRWEVLPERSISVAPDCGQ